jgi:hypothetical protein
VDYEAIVSLRSVDVSTKFQKQVNDASVAFLGGKLQRRAFFSNGDRVEISSLLGKVPKHSFLVLVADPKDPTKALMSTRLPAAGTYHAPLPPLTSAPYSSSISANVKSPSPLSHA